MSLEMKEKGYTNYKARIRTSGPSSKAIKIPIGIGNAGDEVDVYVKVVKVLVPVKELGEEDGIKS